MLPCGRPRDFFHYIACHISGTLEGDITSGRVAKGPQCLEFLRDVEFYFVFYLPEGFIGEVVIEDTRMIVRSSEFRAIFATVVVSYCFMRVKFSQSFNEELEVF